MKSNKSIRVAVKDIRKFKNLLLLSSKKEPLKYYPISKSDLKFFSKCPLCGSGKIVTIAKVVLKKKLTFFSTCVCQNCSLVFRNIFPSIKWFKKCWKIIKIKDPKPFNSETELLRRGEYLKYLEIVQKYKKNGNLLDIGAAYGTGSNVFKEAGFKVEAIEPEINKFTHIRKKFKIKVYPDSLENFILKKTGKQYDVIIFAHCLEHIDNPIKILPVLSRLLKKDGVLYMEVPNLHNSIDWTDALYLAHKFNFSENTLSRLLNRGGLNILEKFKNRPIKEEPFHMGFVLKKLKNKKSVAISPELSIDMIKKLYRKNLPVNFRGTLTYNIDGIEQFYYTLRLNEKKLVYDNKSKTINFETV